MIKIFIDPGHGGDSVGASYKGRLEQDDCLRLALAVRDILFTQKGVEVMLSREDDTDPDLLRRCERANGWGADYFLSVHRNAFSPEAATGVEAWVYSGVQTGGETYTMAENIVNGVCAVTGLRNRGVRKGAPAYRDYAVNNYTKMHSCLLEAGFIDNSEDNAVFDEKLGEIAVSIARSIMENMGLTFVPPAVKGDVDGDGRVTAEDARIILRAAVGLEDADPERGDIDGDGAVTAADARSALRFSSGQEVQDGK
ncbi:MAG: N-acetylmuramoyl-L-alanine amidase [Clostridia bacterium]|nr:N-acetylmuramoyl-L-alanine amidase [Clostridia bacterium]